MGKSERRGEKVLDCFLPGMIHLDGKRGLYPAISLTGRKCMLGCLHCKGFLLEDMIPARGPGELVRVLKELEGKGMKGALISGGCDPAGRIPWEKFLPVLYGIETQLFLSCHTGMVVDRKTAELMRLSGIRQALIDVVGDEETLREIYRLPSLSLLENSLSNLFEYGPEVVPHVVVGINRGKIKGEFKALELLERWNPSLVVLVVIMPGPHKFPSPPVDEVVEVFREARKRFKNISLGCARPRGRYRYELEERLLEEGLVDRIAIWSERCINKAKEMGYKIRYHLTCCSVPVDTEG